LAALGVAGIEEPGPWANVGEMSVRNAAVERAREIMGRTVEEEMGRPPGTSRFAPTTTLDHGMSGFVRATRG